MVAEAGANRIRRVTSDADAVIEAGTGRGGHKDGAGRGATFSQPYGIAAVGAGCAVVVLVSVSG